MKKMLHYQLEKKHIFDSIKFQISQNLELSHIIQITLERVRRLLSVDRLVIYQLNVNYNSFSQHLSRENNELNLVTYEARSSSKIHSILNLQPATNKEQAEKCWAKYRQGFTLAIDDIARANFASGLLSLMHQIQVKAKVVVPINIKGKLWGLLIAHQCHDSRVWHYNETQFLQQIADLMAIAIYQSQSYQELQSQKELLEQQVKNQAQQIEDALVAARVASQSKHEFIGNISHELKTPLTRVIGLSGTLLHWSLEKDRIPLPIEKQQQYLKIIQDSGKHLLKLINDLLQFSDIESAKHLLNLERVALSNFCEEIISSLGIRANNSGIDLSLDFKIKSPTATFSCDRERLQEILINLLDNALKFTLPGGSVILRVWQEKKQLILEIEDTGIGIAEHKIPLLFDTFTPVENFRQRVREGAGIGLALTRHLVELHGGNIEVESEQGKGSIFRVCLPISELSKQKAGNTEQKNSNLSPKKQKKVLLITQDDALATSICQFLNHANHKVIWLIDAMTAIDRIDFLEPQTIILDRDNLDIEIPDVTDTLKTMDNIAHTKIILLYSQMKSEEWQHFIDNNICDRIQKTTNFAQLLKAIEEAI